MNQLFRRFSLLTTEVGRLNLIVCNELSTVARDNLPKKPLSPYADYVKVNYKKISQQLPEKTKAIEVMKKLAEEWKKMSMEEKQAYFKKANENRSLYLTKKDEYFKSLTSEDATELRRKLVQERVNRIQNLKKLRLKRERKINDMPKRPMGAFMLFCQTLDRGEAKVYEFAQGAASKWRMMTEDDKKKFHQLSAEKYAEYEQKLQKWEAKMISEGKTSITRRSTTDKLRSNVQKESNKKQKKAEESTTSDDDSSSSSSSSESEDEKDKKNKKK